MSEFLSNLTKAETYKRSKKRVGRGAGSGKGFHTSGKGNKGQKARSGGKTKIYFEGGQMPLIRRLPYREGFKNVNSKNVKGINLENISKLKVKENSLTPDFFYNNNSFNVKKGTIIKILSKGELKSKLDFKGFEYSEKAKAKIEKAGGTVA